MAKSVNVRHYYTRGKRSVAGLVRMVLESAPETRNNDKLLVQMVQYEALVADGKLERDEAIEDYIRMVSTNVVPSHGSIRHHRSELQSEFPPTDLAVAECRQAHRDGALIALPTAHCGCGMKKVCPAGHGLPTSPIADGSGAGVEYDLVSDDRGVCDVASDAPMQFLDPTSADPLGLRGSDLTDGAAS